MRSPWLLSITTLALCLAGRAQAAGRTLKADELDAYCRLNDARALADARLAMPGGGGKAGEAKSRAEFQKVLADAGWTQERFAKAQDVVDTSLSYLQTLQSDPEEAKGFWDGYEQVDAGTIELVKARRAQLEGAPERARAALRDDQVSGALGRPVTPAELQGAWRRDAAATKAHLVSALHFSEAQAAEVLKVQVEQTLIFSGDQVESRQAVNGKADVYKGTYQIQGREVAFSYGGKKLEKLQVGLKSPRELIMGYLGIPSGVYLKQ